MPQAVGAHVAAHARPVLSGRRRTVSPSIPVGFRAITLSVLFVGLASFSQARSQTGSPDPVRPSVPALGDPAQPTTRPTLPEDARKRVEELETQIRALREQAQYAQAIPLAAEILAIRQKHQPFWDTPGGRKEWWETADARRLVESLTRAAEFPASDRAELAAADRADSEIKELCARAEYPEMVALARSQLATRRRLLGDAHADTVSSLHNLGQALLALGKRDEAESALRDALDMLQRALGSRHPDVATCVSSLGQLSLAKGQYPAAEQQFREALALSRELLNIDHPDMAQRLNSLAAVMSKRGNFAEAEPLFREVLLLWRQLRGNQDPEVANCLNNLAVVLQDQGRLQEAEMLHREALAIREASLSNDHPDLAQSLNGLGAVLYLRGQYAEAERFYSRALDVYRGRLADDRSRSVNVLNNLGQLYRTTGDYVRAELFYREALAIRRRNLGNGHPDTAKSLGGLARVLELKGDYPAAEALFREALAVRRDVLGADHPDVAESMNNLAAVLTSMGSYEAAESLFREALPIRRKRLGDRHPDVAQSLNNLAAVLEERHDYPAAERLYREALDLYRDLLGDDHPRAANARHNLARVLKAIGDYENAEALFREALAARRKAYGERHPDVAASLKNLADLVLARGDYQTAEGLYADALRIVGSLRTRVLGDERARATFSGAVGAWNISASLAGVLLRQDRADIALATLERGHGRELLDLLARSDRDLILRLRSEGRESTSGRGRATPLPSDRRHVTGDGPAIRLVSFQATTANVSARSDEVADRPTLPPDASKRVDELRRQIDEFRQKARYADAVQFAEDILAIRKRHQPFWDGPQGRDEWWETADARRLVDMLRMIAALPAATQAELSEADAATDRIHVLFEQGQYDDAAALARRAMELRRSHFGGASALVAESLNDLAEPLRESGASDEAEPLYREALTILRGVVGSDHPLHATVTNNLAVLLHQRDKAGDYIEAERLYTQSLAVRRRLLGDEHKDVAESLTNLGALLQERGRYAGALPLLREAMTTFCKLLGDDHILTAAAENNLGSLYQRTGEYGAAEPLLRKSLTTLRQRLGDEHPYVATCMNNLGYFLDSKGDVEVSERFLREALALRQKTLGDEHELVAQSERNVAGVLTAKGDYVQAEMMYRKALAICRRLQTEPHADTARTLNDFAGLLESKGDIAAAEPLYREALHIFRKVYGEEHPQIATVMNNLALLLELKGEMGEAEQLHRGALEMSRKLLGNDHPATALSLSNLAMLLPAKGELAAAETLIREALEIVQRSLGEDHPRFAITLNNMASLHYSQRDYLTAEAEYRRSLESQRRALGREHPETLIGQKNLAAVLAAKGDDASAATEYEEAMRLAESLRTRIIGSERERAMHAERLSLGQISASYAGVLLRLERTGSALPVLERARSRALLDLLARADRDLSSEVQLKAEQPDTAARLETLLAQEKDARAQTVEAEARLAKTRERSDLQPDEKSRLIAEQIEAVKRARQKQADAESSVLAMLRDVWPDAKPLDTDAILKGLEPGEILFCYSWSSDAVLLLIAKAEEEAGSVRGLFVAEGKEAVEKLTDLAARVQKAITKTPEAADDPDTFRADARELFAQLLPEPARADFVAARRIVVLPDGPLNVIPLEALIANSAAGRMRAGPEIAYAPSATVYLNRRAEARAGAPRRGPSTVVVLGDPVFDRHRPEPEYPQKGLLVMRAIEGGNAAQAGLTRGDVCLSYDGQDVETTEGLTGLRDSVERAVQAGERPENQPVTVRYWRGGQIREVALKPGKLGLEFDKGSSPADGLKHLAMLTRGSGEAVANISATDQVRLFGGSLQPLEGTRREAEQVAKVIDAAGGTAVMLVGDEATVGQLEMNAAGKRILHIASHGLTGSSERPYDAAIALTQPETPTPDDIGFLRLDDLIRRWRGRLKGCELVVLSACDTQRGVKVGDSIMSLPWGFFYAGAPTVIASLWKVDDTATALLMIRLYENLLGQYKEPRADLEAGHPMPKVAALAEAKLWLCRLTAAQVESLRKQYDLPLPAYAARGEPVPPSAIAPSGRVFEHPYYWASFVLIGNPE